MSVFDPSASWIPAQLKKPVKEALRQGWKPGKDRIKGGGWFIYSPKRTEKFYIPITCKDPDEVAKKLRSLVNKAYTHEASAFEPTPPPGSAEYLSHLADQAIMKGAMIIPGPVPRIRCPLCDVEYVDWEAFANHQEECTAAHPPAVQQAEVPEEGAGAESPSEDVVQDVTESVEPEHPGTISTKEETQLDAENTTPTPEPTRKKKGGYTWTHVQEPLHQVLYEAVKYNRRWKDETDSKWTKRLAQYIAEEGLLDRIAVAGDPDMQATVLLDQIRELLGEGVIQGPSEAEVEQFKKDIAEKDTQIADLTKKVNEYGDFFSAMSEMAPKEPK